MNNSFLKLTDLSISEKAEVVKNVFFNQKIGNFNDFPPNYKEIGAHELFDTQFRTYYPSVTEYRQMIEPNKAAISAHLYWYFDGTGVGYYFDNKTHKLKWFKFAVCLHELTDSVCRKCGYKYVKPDSSD